VRRTYELAMATGGSSIYSLTATSFRIYFKCHRMSNTADGLCSTARSNAEGWVRAAADADADA
jgi:hypothetical protein